MARGDLTDEEWDGSCAGFWSITRRLYVQSPRPLRKRGLAAALHAGHPLG